MLLALLITLALTILTAWTRLRRAAAAVDAPPRTPAAAPRARLSGSRGRAASLAKQRAADRPAPPPPQPQAPGARTAGPDGLADGRRYPPLPRARTPTTAAARSPTRRLVHSPATGRAHPPPPVPVRPPAAARPFSIPPGAVRLLAPDPAASAADRRRMLQRTLDQATGAVLVVSDDLCLWHGPARRTATPGCSTRCG